MAYLLTNRKISKRGLLVAKNRKAAIRAYKRGKKKYKKVYIYKVEARSR